VLCIVGKATLTTVVSSNAMNMPPSSTASARQAVGGAFCGASAGVSVGQPVALEPGAVMVVL